MRRDLITLRRIFSSGLKNFFRNSWLTVAATAVMVVSLVTILSAAVLNVTARNAITELSKSLKVSVYLKDEVRQVDVNRLQSEIKSSEYVAEVKYVSKEDAQKEFSASFQNDQKILEGLALVGSNSLPASLEISVTDITKMQEIGEIPLQGTYQEAVDSVSLGKTDAKKTIDRAASAQRYITSLSVIAAVVFAVVSMLIIFNTIRMAIFTRAEEIKIMKLLGATPGYIRGPFLVESSIYGILSGMIAATVVVLSVYSLGGKVASQKEFSATYNFFTEPSIIVAMFIAAMMVGILVGVISSMLAMEKHLKLKHW